MAKKKAKAKPKAKKPASREDLALDRILAATNALLGQAGTDPSGRYVRRIEANARELEATVAGLQD